MLSYKKKHYGYYYYQNPIGLLQSDKGKTLKFF